MGFHLAMELNPRPRVRPLSVLDATLPRPAGQIKKHFNVPDYSFLLVRRKTSGEPLYQTGKNPLAHFNADWIQNTDPPEQHGLEPMTSRSAGGSNNFLESVSDSKMCWR